jgi:hypothetical protein
MLDSLNAVIKESEYIRFIIVSISVKNEKNNNRIGRKNIAFLSSPDSHAGLENVVGVWGFLITLII